MKKLILTLVVLSMIVACGGLVTKKVPFDRVYKKNFLVKTEERNVEVTIARDSEMSSSENGLLVYVDGYKVSELYGSETVTIYLYKGKHIFEIFPASKGDFSYRTFNGKLIDIRHNILFMLTINSDGKTEMWPCWAA